MVEWWSWRPTGRGKGYVEVNRDASPVARGWCIMRRIAVVLTKPFTLD